MTTMRKLKEFFSIKLIKVDLYFDISVGVHNRPHFSLVPVKTRVINFNQVDLRHFGATTALDGCSNDKHILFPRKYFFKRRNCLSQKVYYLRKGEFTVVLVFERWSFYFQVDVKSHVFISL